MEKTGLSKLAENRMKQILAKQEQLVAGWSPFLNEVDDYMQDTRGRKLNENERRNVAQVLQNALDESGLRKSKLFEATQEDDISFLGLQLPVIAALLPTLVLNDLAIVQALDRRLASVFFFDVLYGSAKGRVAVGDTMISSRTGHARTGGSTPGSASTSERRYAMARVEGELISAVAAASGNYTGTVAYAPGVQLGSVTIVDGQGDEMGSDIVANGVIADTTWPRMGVTGTITAAGVYNLTANASFAESSSSVLRINYNYQYDLPVDTNNNYDGVPEVDFTVLQENIEAIDFPVRSRYSVGASIDLLKAHGINLESEVVKYLGNEIKWTIDHYGIDLIVDAATNGVLRDPSAGTTRRLPATAITAWDANVGEGEPWIWKKWEIVDRFEEGSNNIFSATLRGEATAILCGNSVARVIKQLVGSFKRSGSLGAGKVATGPRNIGTLDDRIVVQDPFMDDETYVMLHKGSNLLYAGLEYKTAA